MGQKSHRPPPYLSKIAGDRRISKHASEVIARLPSQGQAFHSPDREKHDIFDARAEVISFDVHLDMSSDNSRDVPQGRQGRVVACALNR